jgi:Tol biopolymer transport system component/DNA-binding winged helix-turn-helix (wHTH) protein
LVATPAHTGSTWRFGIFEVNAHREELHRTGIPIKIRENSFRILVFLLQHPGEIVTREQLRAVLWPADTFVDFEHGLNTAIMKLREAVDDSAETPLYIETIPKRGYRFIAPVTIGSDEEAAPVKESINNVPASGEVQVTSAPDAEPTPTRRRYRFWQISSVALIALLILASAVWFLFRPVQQPFVSTYKQLTHEFSHKYPVDTDGVRIYFNRGPELESVAQLTIGGGETESLKLPLKDSWLFAVSPDGATLLLSSPDGVLWTARLPELSLHHLTDGPAISAAWSPDGKSVAYATRRGEIFLVQSDGTNPQLIASLHEPLLVFVGEIAWSPDGKTIRFTRDRRIWEIASNGSGLHPFLPEWHPSSGLCCGRWSPDGRNYMFVSDDAALGPLEGTLLNTQVYAVHKPPPFSIRSNPDPVRLTTGPMRWGYPIPSRDGKQIFARGLLPRGELVRSDPRSGQLVPYLSGISAEFVTFSPDGKSLAYVTFPEGILYRANRDGSNPVQMTVPPLYPTLLQWSRDGSQIMFCSPDSSGKSKSFVLPSGGGTPEGILPNELAIQSDPNWSPDGRKVVFASNEKIAGQLVNDVRILDLDTHAVTILSGSQNRRSPHWSPDGRYMAALSGSTDDLAVYEFKTSQWSRLAPGVAGFPTWSHDGQYIYFLRPPPDQGVFRVRPTGGNIDRVADLRQVRVTGIFDFTLSLDPDDAPILLRDVGTDEIFALTIEQK